MTHGRLHELNDLGQSVWLDCIKREWLDDGELERMLDSLSIRGVTSNPTIFAAALESDTYDTDIVRLIGDGVDDRTIFEQLEVDDLTRTCDVLRGVWMRSDGVDGMVSIEVEPDLAYDTAETVARARHLWQAVNRPNLMIKVPATDEGLPAIEQLLFEGINVNVTLLFSCEVYRAVMERYLVALERRAAAGLGLEVRSVASFFVSRVDTKVDAALERAGGDATLAGKVAVANAVAAYAAHREVFAGERFARLAGLGAQPQRPLWASTGTKNQAYSDILYVQDLIVPGSVNTMPPATLDAFADHGDPRVTIDTQAIARAHDLLGELASAGIDLGVVTAELRSEGVDAFQASYEQLLSRISAKRAELVGGR